MGKIILNGNEYVTSTTRGFPPLIYSDAEREIGVWRDGKPLYQKTLTGTFNNATTNQILELTNETIVKADGYLMLNDGSGNTMQLGSYLLSNYYCGWYVYSGSLYIFCSSGFANANYAIVILYTKSTDTAGSGIWTTQGTYAHHFSNNEQVIGTWINGETIYEKTYEFSSDVTINGNTWYDTSFSASGIDKIISIKAMNNIGSVWDFFGASCDESVIQLVHTRSVQVTIRYITLQYTKSSS